MDPTNVEISWNRDRPRKGQWDMGHKPEYKYSNKHNEYMSGLLSDSEFYEWYQVASHYRPELPTTNRCHKFENKEVEA